MLTFQLQSTILHLIGRTTIGSTRSPSVDARETLPASGNKFAEMVITKDTWGM
jgi:hypothetical protein